MFASILSGSDKRPITITAEKLLIIGIVYFLPYCLVFGLIYALMRVESENKEAQELLQHLQLETRRRLHIIHAEIADYDEGVGMIRERLAEAKDSETQRTGHAMDLGDLQAVIQKSLWCIKEEVLDLARLK